MASISHWQTLDHLYRPSTGSNTGFLRLLMSSFSFEYFENFRTLEAKYLSEFRRNLLVFITQLLAKSVCNVKL